MKTFTRQRFEEIAKHGCIRKPTGQTPPGEGLCESFFEAGVANGYSLADICHFYAHVQRAASSSRKEKLSEMQVLDDAYDRFVQDIAAFAGTTLDAAKGIKPRAAISIVRVMLSNLLRPLAYLGKLFLSSRR